MQILTLVRNYIPSYIEVTEGGWDIGKVAARSHDLEDKSVGIVGMGRIGQRVAARLKPFDVRTSYFDYRRLTTSEEQTLGARYSQLLPMVRESDVVSINIPLTPATQGLFNRELLYSMRKGAYLVNTARGRIVETDARKASHIFATFFIPLIWTPAVIEGVELYHQWYLSVTWKSFAVFVIPYALMIRPIRSKVRLLYLGHRSFDRPEDRPYTLIWFMTQMLAIGLLLVPMSQYFLSNGVWSLYLIAAMSNGLGDGLAEPIGKVFGKKKYKVRALFTDREYTRSYVGSACVAFFTTLGILINIPILSTGELVTLLAILPALITVIEAKSPHTWDNVFIYLACWAVVYLVVLA